MDYAYMGFYDLFDHLLEPPPKQDEHANAAPDAANVSPISSSRFSKSFGRRKTDLQTGREGTAAIRRTNLSSLQNKVE